MKLRVKRLSMALGQIALWFVVAPLLAWKATPLEWLVGLAILVACWVLAELFWPSAARWFSAGPPWLGVMLVGSVACLQLAKSDLLAEAARSPVSSVGTGLLMLALILINWRNRHRLIGEAAGKRTA